MSLNWHFQLERTAFTYLSSSPFSRHHYRDQAIVTTLITDEGSALFFILLYLGRPEKKDPFSFAGCLCNKNTRWVARVGKTGSRKAWRKERRDPSSRRQPCHWIRISESLIFVGLVRRKGRRKGRERDPEGVRQRVDKETERVRVKQQTEAGRIFRKKRAKKRKKKKKKKR